MKINFDTRKGSVSEQTAAAAEKKLTKLDRFFNSDAVADVKFSEVRGQTVAEITVRAAHMIFRAEDRASDDYTAMKQAVDKILKTDRFVYPIYTEDYGNDLETLIGSSVSYAKTEVHRMTTEALSADDRVTQVEIKEIKQTAPDVLSVSGVCYTIYGPINIDTEVVLIES